MGSLIAICCCLAASSTMTVNSFVTSPSSSSIKSNVNRRQHLLRMSRENQDNSSRRHFLSTCVAGFVAGTFQPTEPAHATYSAYTAREKDWQERMNKGEIQVLSARDLRKQLREIAPANTANSKIFCPNGPSAAVSPLMEIKCGDQLAMPSVYGRTSDTVGNSIPGFTDGYYSNVGGAGATQNIAATAGGFPKY